MTIRALILGGTSEARALAAVLTARPDVSVTSSLAGRVRDPALPAGAVRSGGFGGAEGLAAYLLSEQVDVLIDATHPYAVGISTSAASASTRSGVPLLAIRRPPWQQQAGDRWTTVPDLPGARSAIEAIGRIFLTTGRTSLAAFADVASAWFLVRTVDEPTDAVPARMTLLLDRGPYTVAGERTLMLEHRVEVLVTKNSGGSMTRAKIIAARELGLPVVMVDRPRLPDVPAVSTVDEAVAWLDHGPR